MLSYHPIGVSGIAPELTPLVRWHCRLHRQAVVLLYNLRRDIWSPIY